MLSIRYNRAGKKNSPFFKLVITDSRRSSTSGKFLEDLGYYNPKTKESKIKAERVKHWLAKGAKPSSTVHNLLVSAKIIEAKKIAIFSKRKVKEGDKK